MLDLRNSVDTVMLLAEALNLREASAEIEQRFGLGTTYTFKLGDQFVRAEIVIDYVKVETNTEVVFEDYLQEASKTFVAKAFHIISKYIYDEHA